MRWRKITAKWFIEMMQERLVITFLSGSAASFIMPSTFSFEQDDVIKVNGDYYICEVVR